MRQRRPRRLNDALAGEIPPDLTLSEADHALIAAAYDVLARHYFELAAKAGNGFCDFVLDDQIESKVMSVWKQNMTPKIREIFVEYILENG